jgi:aldose 1-epimerase
MKWMAALIVAALALPGLAAAQARYTIKTNGDVVQLRDANADMTVSVLTPVNNAYEIVLKGQNILRMAIKSVDEMRARPGLNGVPLLSPFANRLDETAFYANGQKYNFDLELGNVRGPIPIHGYLSGANAWKVVEAKADANGAWVTSKLDFYRIPAYMKQFPFAHTLTMTYRLARGTLEVHTRIDNLSSEPMPVAIGFHPYLQLTDSVRNDWTLNVGARTHWVLGSTKVPTGETEPAATFFGGDQHQVPLQRFATRSIDDVFSDLERDAQGQARVTMSGKKQSLSIRLGPKFKAVLVYSTVPGAQNPPPAAAQAAALAPRPPAPPAPPAPPPVSVGPAIPLTAPESTPDPLRGFVAFEPMVGITDSMNLAQKGMYKELQSVPPGGSWEESFWIEPTGY